MNQSWRLAQSSLSSSGTDAALSWVVRRGDLSKTSDIKCLRRSQHLWDIDSKRARRSWFECARQAPCYQEVSRKSFPWVAGVSHGLGDRRSVKAGSNKGAAY